MKIKSLFPKFNIPVHFKELKDHDGEYWFKSDIIIINSSLKKTLPGCAKFVLLHEMIHSTGADKRLMRMQRLINNFGPYAEGSMSDKMEECIAEVGCMVAAIKLGLFNEYSRSIIFQGLKENYSPDMYIPIREIRAAVKYFAEDDTSFEDEIKDAKEYLEAYLEIKFQDSYVKKEVA